MRTWVYPAAVTRHGDDDFTVVFRDVPEAVTGGATRAEALANAADALEEAILAYMADGRARARRARVRNRSGRCRDRGGRSPSPRA